MMGNGCITVKESTMNTTMANLYDTVNRLEALNERMHSKLAPIMGSDYPCPPTEDMKQEEYPPLFNDLRHVNQRLISIMGSMDNALGRCEI